MTDLRGPSQRGNLGPTGAVLPLIITVQSESPDQDPDSVVSALLANANRYERYPTLGSGEWSITVVNVVRADGVPLGAEREFEEYWQARYPDPEAVLGGDLENVKSVARECFLAAFDIRPQGC